jgi:nicotinate phosphoribosyltransferase
LIFGTANHNNHILWVQIFFSRPVYILPCQIFECFQLSLGSGDLAWLAKESRRMLDEAGLDYVKIAASNQIDENVIKSLLDQNAPIDLFGVGTSLVTGRPDSALDGVYKLSFANEEPRLKLSETVSKINLPGKKQVYRLFNKDGSFYGGEVVALADEEDFDIMVHPSDPKQSRILTEFTKEPLLEKVVENGKRISKPRATDEIAEFSLQQLEKLPKEFKRFDNPHVYKVGLTKKLKELRDSLVRSHKERV